MIFASVRAKKSRTNFPKFFTASFRDNGKCYFRFNPHPAVFKEKRLKLQVYYDMRTLEHDFPF
jgi:hypothetical protein